MTEQRIHELEKFDHALELRLVKLETQQESILKRADETYVLLKNHCNTSPCDDCRNKHEIEKIKFNLRIVNWVGTIITGSMIVSIMQRIWAWLTQGAS